MPIFNIEGNTKVADPITPDRKLYSNPEFKTSTLFNKDQELNDIIQYVEGYKWTVDYFQQVREINTPPVMPDPNDTTTLVNYNRINNLIIYLESPINQDDPNNITGTASINAGFLPNYGDPFISELTGGRYGVFVISSVEKKMYSLHDMYTVEFKLLVFLDKDSLFYKDLLLKTVKEYIYDKNFIQDKSAPIILSKDFKDKLDYGKEVEFLKEYYYKTMFNPAKNIISLPTNSISSSIYLDTLLNEFNYKLNGYTGYPNANKIVRFNVTDITDYSIFDLLFDRDIDKLSFVRRNLGFKYVPSSVSYPSMRHISWLGINYITQELDNGMLPQDYSNDLLENTLTRPPDYVEPVVLTDTDYVFSDNFYNEDTVNMSILERLIYAYLNNETIITSELDILLKQYRHWEMDEQYYYIPMLILLLKYKMNNIYSNV